MYIYRDITHQLEQASAPIQILLGPRQCGKSTLFASLSYSNTSFKEITFDDLQLRLLANRDPALFLQQFHPPLMLDEIQYVPALFSELKKRIDEIKKNNLFHAKSHSPLNVLFRLTGSNQILLDQRYKETMAGRASYYFLNTLTVHEICSAFPQVSVNQILFKGGWPEIYVNPSLSIIHYLNDYIRTYVEKDVFLSAGIEKIFEFQTTLSTLGARTGYMINYSDISKDTGISSGTVKEWLSLLERADLIYLLKPYYSNLNKRLIKTPKLYFLDTGLAVRLQGWQDPMPLLHSPLIGALFETLVCAEIIKFIRNYRKNWQLFYWRTKEGEEIDFIIITSSHKIYALESKLALQHIPPAVTFPPTFKKHFMPLHPLTIITYGGSQLSLSPTCQVVPITLLHDYLHALEE